MLQLDIEIKDLSLILVMMMIQGINLSSERGIQEVILQK